MPAKLQPRLMSRLRSGAVATALVAAGGLLFLRASASADASATVVPPAAQDEPRTDTAPQTAVFAGGCFWGVQGVFQHVKGVTQAVSGYAGGERATADYETVSTGRTGHAESVAVTYDPRKISYGQLLQVYFSVAHDPTELNRQGPDSGTQYRSQIFPQNAEQTKIADAYIAQLGTAHVFSSPIVTRVAAAPGFFPAEAYHQNYLTLHPTSMYIAINDLPKVAALKHMFPDLYRDKPVLVGAAVTTN